MAVTAVGVEEEVVAEVAVVVGLDHKIKQFPKSQLQR